jgi:hypothetical protein
MRLAKVASMWLAKCGTATRGNTKKRTAHRSPITVAYQMPHVLAYRVAMARIVIAAQRAVE